MKRVYRNHRVVLMSEKAKRIIELLFHTFMKQPEALPEIVQHRLCNEKKRFKYKRHQKKSQAEVVADHIAGMTDKYAMDLYQVLVDAYEKAL